MQQALLIILLIVSIGWLVLRIRRNKADIAAEKAPKILDQTGAFHAVSLSYNENACVAAKELTGRRFLSTAAPRLPLGDCDALECRCQFAHHKDRRSGHDRRSPFTPGGAGFDNATGKFKTERRQTVERRKK